MRLFVRDQLASRYGLVYETEEECFEDRIDKRDKWHALIAKYNQNDLSKLSCAIFKEYDIYVGIRSRIELDASRHLADLVLWIDRPDWQKEPTSSNTLDPSDADVIVSAKTVQELHIKLGRLFDNFDYRPFIELDMGH
jgi:hypothetical protein